MSEATCPRCDTCWFNTENDGSPMELSATVNGLRDAGCVRCQLRGGSYPNPVWTYCANHQLLNPGRIAVPVGSVYVRSPDVGQGELSRRVLQPGPSEEDVRIRLIALLDDVSRGVADWSPAPRFEEELIRQLMVLGESRAIPALRRIAAWTSRSDEDEAAGLDERGLGTVGCALEALASLVGDDVAPWLRTGLQCSARAGGRADLDEGAQDPGWRLRVHAAAALQYMSTEVAREFAGTLLSDPHPRVLVVAEEALARASSEDRRTVRLRAPHSSTGRA